MKILAPENRFRLVALQNLVSVVSLNGRAKAFLMSKGELSLIANEPAAPYG